MPPELRTNMFDDVHVTTDRNGSNPIYKVHLKNDDRMWNFLDDFGRSVLCKVKKSDPIPTKIIRNGRVTVIIWKDGTKTLVRRAEGAEDDPYLAFCAGLAKKIYGDNTKVKKLIKELTVETKEKEKRTND